MKSEQKINFKNWLLKESKDIYGFDKSKNLKASKEHESPVIPIDPEIVMLPMMGEMINNEMPFSSFHDQIQWGKDVGAIKMVITPLGSFKSIIRKMTTDLEGNKIWICKKIIPYNDLLHVTKEFDEKIGMKVLEEIKITSKEGIEAPERGYTGLEKLTHRLSNFCRRGDVLPELFIYRGIRQIKKNENYIIHFECKGQGVEGPGSSRLEQFNIEMSYNPHTGIIRSFGYDIQSKTRQHLWYPQPSEWDEIFSPKQTEKEIIECIGNAFKTY